MERPAFRNMVEHKLEPGDTLVVLKLDRLGRDNIDVQQTITTLQSRDVRVVSLDLPAQDLASANGKLILQMFAAFAEFERNRIRERTQEGLERAKSQGKKLGRPVATSTTEKVQRLKEQGLASHRRRLKLGWALPLSSVTGIRAPAIDKLKLLINANPLALIIVRVSVAWPIFANSSKQIRKTRRRTRRGYTRLSKTNTKWPILRGARKYRSRRTQPTSRHPQNHLQLAYASRHSVRLRLDESYPYPVSYLQGLHDQAYCLLAAKSTGYS